MTRSDELLDLAGRIMLTHRIAPEHLHKVIGGDLADAEEIVENGRFERQLDSDTTGLLALFVNVLLRLEWRLRGDGCAIRRAVETPIDELHGKAPADLFGSGPDDLLVLRRAIEMIEAPRERWFRVGH